MRAVVTMALFVGLLWQIGTAVAAPPELILQVPEISAAPNGGAGRLDNPRGVAVNPSNGHIYVADLNNARVDEYTAWGWFIRSWGWGVVDGSSELQMCGPTDPESDPTPSLCQKGVQGSGKGQMAWPWGMTVDGAGNVYVFEAINLRVQKFSPTGQFQLMFGGDVNKTKVEEGAPAAQRNVCPLAPADACQKGTGGEAPSHFAGTGGDYVEYSATANAILVGDKDRIQSFDLEGSFKGEIPFEGPLGAFAGDAVNGLAVDSSGNVYFSLAGDEDVYKVDAAGAPLAPGKPGESKFEARAPLATAVDSQGNVFAIDDPLGFEGMVLQYDAAGKRLLPTEEEEEDEEFFPYIPFQGPALTGLATNLCTGSDVPGNLYLSSFLFGAVSKVDVYGTAPIGCEDPPPRPPEIEAQYALSAGREEATVRAEINPRSWPNSTYYVEYGTGKCSAGGCDRKQPLTAPILTDKSVNKPVRTAGVFLPGLEPGTTYHYRFVAESGGGGPVFGGDPDGKGPEAASFDAGAEGTFKTYALSPPQSCPGNEMFRDGPAVRLPDCRAYELVSPLDKGGGDAAPSTGQNGVAPRKFEINLSSIAGDRFTFTSGTAFADPRGASFASQYLSDRTEAGWSSESISPSRTLPPVGAEDLLQGEFHGFSPDLCAAWLRHYSVAPLVKGGVPGFANIYRRENCGAAAGSYAPLSLVEPPTRAPNDYTDLWVQGFSADGTHTIFTANDALDPQAPHLKGENEQLLYEYVPGGSRFVCYLPNGLPLEEACAAGTLAGGGESSVRNAISADGSRIFWTAFSGTLRPGRLYVRVDGTETVEVSGAISSDPAWFWTASDDGAKAIFEFDADPLHGSRPFEDQLYEFDMASETSTLIAEEVVGPLGASEDASRLYFASEADLDETGPAVAGEPNLYFYESELGGGTATFIMSLVAGDIGASLFDPSPIALRPVWRSAQVSPDGLHAAFVSAAPSPNGYDNRDAASGELDEEVYLYDAVEQELRCVSCNPSGARPRGEDIGTPTRPVSVAAKLEGWETLLHAPRVLSGDGTRVYFESIEALVPDDVNSAWDVYQWEELGKGSCTKAAQAFSEDSGGCVELISSGESAADSVFLDADPSGDNVFLGTQASLVAGDYDLNDVYDARVGGGFPERQPRQICEGEACQSPPPPPAAVTPASEAFVGPADPVRTKPRCRKGTRRVRRRGKVRCVPRHRSKAGSERRRER